MERYTSRRKTKQKKKLKEGVPDILQLSDLSTEAMIETLAVRYSRDEVYTFVGPILISINPYKWTKNIVKMYSEETMQAYQGQPQGARPPHLFAVADRAYTELAMSRVDGEQANNQSIIISGESGAGKTEATKIIMQYLARVTHSQKVTAHILNRSSSSQDNLRSTDAQGKQNTSPLNRRSNSQARRASFFGELGTLESRVLDANPLLESFGNAKTLRNDNSSRFGKFIEIQFDHTGLIIGAKISNFLLEKTRIITQTEDERNYHIFYQLLAGADEQMKKEYHLTAPEDYHYLNQSNCYTLDGRSDADEYETTRDCMTSIGISMLNQDNVFRLLAAILHLGNINFKMEDDHCVPDGEVSEKSLCIVADLLGVAENLLRGSLCKRKLVVQGKIIEQEQRVDQAADKRDALAKALYSSLFLWLVAELNLTTAAEACSMKLPESVSGSRSKERRQPWGFIGVLDIYGFEQFEINTFEQLCINYANEKLQRHFNKHIFEVEQQEYVREGIDWTHISFNDNTACVELIEGKPNSTPGILMSLDDCWRLTGEEANYQFLASLHSKFGQDDQAKSHPNYVKPKFNAEKEFGIIHYAGKVCYDVSGWNDKNAETLNADLQDLIAGSDSAWIVNVFDKAVRERLDAGSAGTDVAGPSLTRKASQNTPVKGDRRRATTGNTSTPSRSPVKSTGPRRATHFSSGSGSSGTRGNLREKSVSLQFKSQLTTLMATIESTQPHYIRCIKPNEFKLADTLEEEDCVTQLRYAGMFEAVRIRRAGYALREDQEDFFNHYKILQPDAQDLEELVGSLSKSLCVEDNQWQLGQTRIFLKASLCNKLDGLVRTRVSSAARLLQRWWLSILRERAAVRVQSVVRCVAARRKYLMLRTAAALITNRVRGFIARCRYRVQIQVYRKEKEMATKIQAAARGYLVRANMQRDVYSQLGKDELLSMIAKTERDLAKAIGDKHFDRCPRLQVSLDAMKASLASRKTRADYAVEIKETKQRLDEAMKSKDFNRCQELQVALEALETAYKTAPVGEGSEEEARIYATELEEELGGLMKQKKFNECKAIQQKLDKLYEQYPQIKSARAEKEAAEAETPEAQKHKLKELRKHMVDLKQSLKSENDKLHEAMQAKRFRECDSIQKKTNELETALSAIQEEVRTLAAKLGEADNMNGHAVQLKRDPLLIKKEIVQKERDLKMAMEKKHFSTCAELNEELARLREQLSSTLADAKSKQQAFPTDTTKGQAINPAPSPPRSLAAPKILTARQSTKNFGSTVNVEGSRSLPRGDRDSLDSRAGNVTGREASSAPRKRSPERKQKTATAAAGGEKTVANLRPSHAQTLPPGVTVMEAARTMKKKRVDAALVVGSHEYAGETLLGIITDTDVTRRVIAEGLDPALTLVSEVMTPNPTCVDMADQAVDALRLMLDGRFRHLPVVFTERTSATQDADDEPGISVAVAGILSINKCLYTAIRRLEKAVESTESLATTGHGLANVLKPMMDKMFSPPLHTVVESEGPPPIVDEHTSVGEAALLMADARKAALIVGESEAAATADGTVEGAADGARALVGIFTPKDLLYRVVAAGLDPSLTPVSQVMTTEPETVTPHMSVIDALHTMASNKVLNLPVVLDEDEQGEEGRGGVGSLADVQAGVVGLVDVLSICYGSFAKGHSEDWINFWNLAFQLEMYQQDQMQKNAAAQDGLWLDDDTSSIFSDDLGGGGGGSLSRQTSSRFRRTPSTGSSRSLPVGQGRSSVLSRARGLSSSASERGLAWSNLNAASRPVSALRPSRAVTLLETVTVGDATRHMKKKRANAALVTSADGILKGIITDTDVTRRVISKPEVDAEVTKISEVMTADPMCVTMDDEAMDALAMMLDGRFRHLPVVDKQGAVVGLLNIDRCLYDAIEKMEYVQANSDAVAESLQKELLGSDQFGGVGARGGTGVSSLLGSAGLSSLLKPVIDKILSPTLHMALEGEAMAPILRPDMTAREAAVAMAAARKAALVISSEDPLAAADETHARHAEAGGGGEGGPGSVRRRRRRRTQDRLVGIVTPKDLMFRITAEALDPDTTPVELVMTMEPDTAGPDCTVLDALHQMHEHKYLNLPVVEALPDGGERIVGLADVLSLSHGTFSQGAAAGDEEGKSGDWRKFWSSIFAVQGANVDDGTASVRSGLGGVGGLGGLGGADEFDYDDTRSLASSTSFSGFGIFLFKVKDHNGDFHRVRSSAERLQPLQQAIAKKIGVQDPARVLLQYEDDDGDLISIANDESLSEAVDSARAAGASRIVLHASLDEGLADADDHGADGQTKSRSRSVSRARSNDAPGLGRSRSRTEPGEDTRASKNPRVDSSASSSGPLIAAVATIGVLSIGLAALLVAKKK